METLKKNIEEEHKHIQEDIEGLARKEVKIYLMIKKIEFLLSVLWK
jgi:hypothetical protein